MRSRLVTPPPITISAYDHARHHARFVALNRAWLVDNDLYEHTDAEQLADPVGRFIVPGGAVFVALDGDAVVGTAAVVPEHDGEWEMAKLTVDPAYRGLGLGKRLVEHCIAAARAGGAARVVLVSNHRLATAIRMYERMGFTHRPRPAVTYASADIFMHLPLGGG